MRRKRFMRRWYRPISFGLAAALMVMAGAILTFLATSDWGRLYGFMNGDLTGYLDGARRFLATGSPYDAAAVAAPWNLGVHSFIHPPPALALFLPFLVLPAALWWLVPLVGTTALVILSRPRPWAWPIIA